jgi:hypothetical protein
MKDTLFKYCTVVAKCITCIAQSLLVGTRRQRLVLCVLVFTTAMGLESLLNTCIGETKITL